MTLKIESEQDLLSTKRHSASHILAQAVMCLYKDVKLGIGPAIDQGFYYDFYLNETLNEESLKAIEKKMRRIIAEKQEFKHYELPKEQALKQLKGQPFKCELVEDLKEETYQFYENGPFVDLCKGPHVKNTSEVGIVKLLRVSGAYWRGNENNKMLQRIYGTAFETQDELDAFLAAQEEAQARDHRKLGKALNLFSIHDDIGPGLVLWHPKGAFIKDKIESFWKKMHLDGGYDLVASPHVGRSRLWETSGHLGFYKDNMYAPVDIEEEPYYVKPMNCPFHIMIYKNAQKSYRQLPLRYAELGTVYRQERSGVLHGLFRVRGFTQDDAHLFCTKEQLQDEIKRVLAFCFKVLSTFEFNEFDIYLSTRPHDKYVGEESLWESAQEALKAALQAEGLAYQVDEGGGAFYGPKIDIKIKDAIGRDWQCSTIQLDFNLPDRFDLSYIDQEGKKQVPIMIHRALFGSLERFMGILIEHYAGKFPLWLHPQPIVLLPLKQSVLPFVEEIKDELSQNNDLPILIDDKRKSLGAKIKQYREERCAYIVIVGEEEAAQNQVSVRHYLEGDLGKLSKDAFIEKVNRDAQKSN